MDSWFELLKLGAAICYLEEKELIVVHLDKKDFETASKAVEILSAIFGVESDEVTISPSTMNTWPVRLEFNYSFGLKRVDERASEIENNGKELTYEIENDVLRLRKYNMIYSLDYQKVKDLFEELPEKATVKDAMKIAESLGLRLDYQAALLLFEFYEKNINFDAKVEKRGRAKHLIKLTTSLSEENRKKLAIEREVVGTPYSVEG